MSFILPSGTWKVNGGNAGRNWRTKIAKPAYNRTRVCGRCAEDRKYASIEDAFKRPCANARWLFCSILLLTCARFHAQPLFAGSGRSKKQILAGGFPGDHGGQLRQILIRIQPQRRLRCVFPAKAARKILAGGLLNVPNQRVGGDAHIAPRVPSNSPGISVKSVCIAGSMWASTPTNVPGKFSKES